MEFVAPLFDDMKDYITKYFDQEIVDKKINPETIGTLFTDH
jgi:23S rRNA pseudouridine1911/1915/1917 synthase